MENLAYVYTLVCGELPKQAKITTERNELFCKYLHIPFKTVQFDAVPGVPISATADKIRLDTAATVPQVLYVDWDCLLIDVPPLNPDFPCFGLYQRHSYDTFIFYNGNRTDLFSAFCELIKKENCVDRYGVYFRPLNRFFKGKCQTILSRYYFHYGLGKGRT